MSAPIAAIAWHTAAAAAALHARRAAPAECCGLLLRNPHDPDRTVAIQPCRNVSPDADAFEIDPLALLASLRAPTALLGFYHSHLSGDAAPSARDRCGVGPAGLGDYHLIVTPAGAWTLFRVRGYSWRPLLAGHAAPGPERNVTTTAV